MTNNFFNLYLVVDGDWRCGMRPSIRILFASLPLLLTSICVVGQTNVVDLVGPGFTNQNEPS